MAKSTRRWMSLALVGALAGSTLGCGAENPPAPALGGVAPGSEEAGGAGEAPDLAGMPGADPEASGAACSAEDCPCLGGDCALGPLDLAPVAMPEPGTTCTDPAGCAPVAGSCDAGVTETAWASTCQSTLAQSCVPGTFQSWGSSSPENYPLRYETEHFAFLWPDERDVTVAQAQAAGEFLENVLWKNYLGSPIFWPEPDCNSAVKRKTSIHIIEGGLFGGCNQGRPGIWVGAGALADHWGLGHEWTHALQCMTPGFPECGAGGCWLNESHANFMSHQLPEYRADVHCSEMLANAPHLYYGSTRDRYCNWQFFEFLKDKYCYSAVNEMWTATAPNGRRDPWSKLMRNMGWDIEQLNDVFGEWALHNITWDYRNPPPTDLSNQGPIYRREYAPLTNVARPERRLRITALEPLDADSATHRRFVSPYLWAPQRWGYNVVRLYPDPGATSVRVTFRGVTQPEANSGFRFGLVATDAELSTSRYSTLQRGTDAELEFCVTPGESLWLVVMATPTELQQIVWDQAYPSIYRYPYMVELGGAWPEGFVGGVPAACAAGERHENGGGCAPAGLPASVYVGPYAQVLGGNVSGNARIDGHAVVLGGATVSGGTVGGLSVLNRFTVSGTARVETTFYPAGFFEGGQGLSGTGHLYGDVEYRGQGLNRNAGEFFGYVDAATPTQPIAEVTLAPPYAWRP